MSLLRQFRNLAASEPNLRLQIVAARLTAVMDAIDDVLVPMGDADAHLSACSCEFCKRIDGIDAYDQEYIRGMLLGVRWAADSASDHIDHVIITDARVRRLANDIERVTQEFEADELEPVTV